MTLSTELKLVLLFNSVYSVANELNNGDECAWLNGQVNENVILTVCNLRIILRTIIAHILKRFKCNNMKSRSIIIESVTRNQIKWWLLVMQLKRTAQLRPIRTIIGQLGNCERFLVKELR